MFVFGEQGDAIDEICIQFYNPEKEKNPRELKNILKR